MTEQELVEAMALAIMCARPNGGCSVRDWEVEAKDNPHVELAMGQATAALAAIRAAGFAVVPVKPSEAIIADLATSVLAAIRAAGFAVVPRVPSEAMVVAGGKADASQFAETMRLSSFDVAEDVWTAMLDAAPLVAGGAQ